MTSAVEMAVGDLFRAVGGDAKYIRDYMALHSGSYPVYSASIVRPFGWVDDFKFDGTFLTWVMNGYGGRMQEISGKFSTNRDRGVLIPREGVRLPDLTYLRSVIEPRLMASAVGRRVDGGKNEYTKIYSEAAEGVTFPLPKASDGDLDFELMTKVGAKMREIERAKAMLASSLEPIARAVFAFEVEAPSVTLALSDERYFSLSIGKRVLRQEFIDEGVPVYSANATAPFGAVRETNLLNFERPSLLWGIDGNFNWNLVDAGQVFATTDHCGRLQVLDESIDAGYLYYYLQGTRERYGFDRVFRASLTNLKAEVAVTLPLDSDGRISVARQRSMASTFKARADARKEVLSSIEALMRAKMTPET